MEAEANEINKDFIKYALKKIELLSASQGK
jgi:hypothetical protein